MSDKELCLKLASSDKEEEVIKLLKEAGYWDNSDCWKFYGGRENNFSTIGNQQSKADQALVEKLINSVDAMFLSECYTRSINPEKKEAPQSITKAMIDFFGIENGRLANMNTAERKTLAGNINLIATGNKSNPSLTIVDKGEGQLPEMMEQTILSLDKSNKLRVPFVQGKFNMGGTGVFQFCGKKNIQLVITKRNPALLNGHTTNKWGFTIVRREDPTYSS